MRRDFFECEILFETAPLRAHHSTDVFTFNFHPFDGFSSPCPRSRSAKETMATFSEAVAYNAISARLRAHVRQNMCANSHGLNGGNDRRKTDVSISRPVTVLRRL